MNGYLITEQQIQDWMRRRVAKYKQLRGGIVLVREIPRLSSGEIARRVVRKWAREDGEILDRRSAKL